MSSERSTNDVSSTRMAPQSAGNGSRSISSRVWIAGYECHDFHDANVSSNGNHNQHDQHDQKRPDAKERPSGPLSNPTPLERFERSQPHWEGRWAGHLHLPFPPLELLDMPDVPDMPDASGEPGNDDGDLSDDSGAEGLATGLGRKRKRMSTVEELGSEEVRSLESKKLHKRKENSSIESSSSESESSSSDESDDGPTSLSREFLPVARKLIHFWAQAVDESLASPQCFCDDDRERRQDCTDATTAGRARRNMSKFVTNSGSKSTNDCSCNDSAGESHPIVIIPHIPMHRGSTGTKADASSSTHMTITNSITSNTSLHISLARPIYLPSSSVDPFLSDIKKSLTSVIHFSRGNNNNKHIRLHHPKGIVLKMQPKNAAIFTNDEQTRSFLTIPVSNESSKWVKSVLLPPIDAVMKRFGLKSYYSEKGEECVLHVSVASAKGNIVSLMGQSQGLSDGFATHPMRETRSIKLFQRDCILREGNGDLEKIDDCLPESIPIQIDQVNCVFGKTKQVVIPL